jgi:hypothetical protein
MLGRRTRHTTSHSTSHSTSQASMDYYTNTASNTCEQQLQNPNPFIYDEELWEVAKGSCSFARTSAAALVPRFTSSISAISSMLIIYMIIISPAKLSSTYHRIMLAISSSDIFYSIASSLSTLPMPSPGDYWTDISNIQGRRMGNTHTCTAQGFFITAGFFSFFIYDSFSLIAFYLCSIGFKVTKEKIEKYVEPLIHCIPIGITFWLTVPLLFKGAYNVSIDQPYCLVSPKPWFCKNNNNGGVECIRGGSVNEMFFDHKHMIFEYTLILMTWRFFCLAIICWKVYVVENKHASIIEKYCSELATTGHNTMNSGPASRVLKRFGKIFLHGRKQDRLVRLEGGQIISMEELIQNGADQYKETKIIALQAMLYIAASILVQLTLIIMDSLPETQIRYKSVMLALSSLEGMYNLLIFTFHKVYNLQRCDNNLSFSEAMKVILNGEAQDSFVITSMKIVSQECASNASNNDGYDIGSLYDTDDNNELVENADEVTPLFTTRRDFPKPSSLRLLNNTSSDCEESSARISSKELFGSSLSYVATSTLSYFSKEQNDEEDISISFPSLHQSKYQHQYQRKTMQNTDSHENLQLLKEFNQVDEEE